MSSVATTENLAVTTAPPSSVLARAWGALERRCAALVDRANPILVKETRQALKSRQFVVTFLVVLIACWIVTFGGVAIVGPSVYYGASGPSLLIAYFAILAFPLTLIVPYTAFRSLAAEQEENTYDLLSITTLGSREIVAGKLWSAAVQMIVYLCAVSPCIAFTFLLRGVDAPTVALLLAMVVLESLGLAVAALLVGAIARARNTQVVISVALVLGLFGAFSGTASLATVIIQEGSGVLFERGFWLFVAMMMTAYFTTFGLVRAAAAAQIAFTSENRSSSLRRWMAVQQACFCGWIGGAIYYSWNQGGFIPQMLAVMVALAGGYWYVMGMLMTGEWPLLSRRVQRSLPSTFVGRTFLSLFNPGPGSGYLFAVANVTTLAMLGLAVILFRSVFPGAWTRVDTAVYAMIIVWAYVTAFLGFGRLVIAFVRRWAYVPLPAAVLIHLIMLLTGVGIPTVIQLMSRQLRYSGYSLIQITNPIWTVGRLIDRGPDSVDGPLLVLLLVGAALAALLLNAPSIAAELARQRIPVPKEVLDEDAAIRLARRSGPSSPWDEEPTAASASSESSAAGR
jgi:hypothetical protein